MAIARYKPGDIVSQSGIYKVYHNSHRLMHEATITEDALRFPFCRQCGKKVRFTLAAEIKGNLRGVPPFRSTAFLEAYQHSDEKRRHAKLTLLPDSQRSRV
jgi:hypothetical protein